MAGYLAGDGDHGDGIKKSVGDSGYQISGSRPGSSETYPHFTGGPGIAVSRMSGPLLVPYEDMAKLGVLGQGVIERDDRSPG